MDKKELISIYASAGYRVVEVDPCSIVFVALKGEESTLAKSLEDQLKENLQEYHLARTGLAQEGINGEGFIYFIKNICEKLSDNPETWILPPLAKIPCAEKYVLLDPFMMHWIFAYHLSARSIPSIVFSGDQQHKAYNIRKTCWEKYPHSLDHTFHDPAQLFDGKKHIDYCIEQYRRGNILFDFETLAERKAQV